MQDAERLQEQIDDMVAKTEARAEVATEHHERVAEQRHGANRELAKFKFLDEVFTLGQNLMNQRRGALLKAEPAPEAHIIEGLDAAVEELQRISRQAQDMVQRWDGSQGALQALEEAFREEKMQATSRARGLAVQGQKAVDVASKREAPVERENVPLVAKAAEQFPEIVDSIEKIEPTADSAKEPIASP